MTRQFDRAPGDLRPVTITPGYLAHAEGSVLIEVGHTKIILSLIHISEPTRPY